MTGTLLAGVAVGMQAAGCDEETTDKLEAHAAALAGFICEYGVAEFFEKWKQDVINKIYKKVEDMAKVVKAGENPPNLTLTLTPNPNPNPNLKSQMEGREHSRNLRVHGARDHGCLLC